MPKEGKDKEKTPHKKRQDPKTSKSPAPKKSESPYRGKKSTFLSEHMITKNKQTEESTSRSSRPVKQTITETRLPYFKIVEELRALQRQVLAADVYMKNLAFECGGNSLVTYEDSPTVYVGEQDIKMTLSCADAADLEIIDSIRTCFKAMKSESVKDCFEKLALGICAANIGDKEWVLTKRHVQEKLDLKKSEEKPSHLTKKKITIEDPKDSNPLPMATPSMTAGIETRRGKKVRDMAAALEQKKITYNLCFECLLF